MTKVNEVEGIRDVLPKKPCKSYSSYHDGEDNMLETILNATLPDASKCVRINEEILRDAFYSKAVMSTDSLRGGVDTFTIAKSDFNKYIREIIATAQGVVEWRTGEKDE